MVPVAAPRFGLDECHCDAEAAFVLALHARADGGGWYADSWLWDDRVVITVDISDPERNCVLRMLRVDFRTAHGATRVLLAEWGRHMAIQVNSLDTGYGGRPDLFAESRLRRNACPCCQATHHAGRAGPAADRQSITRASWPTRSEHSRGPASVARYPPG
jgi:hypothetical protein